MMQPATSEQSAAAVEATLLTRAYRATRREPARKALNGVSLTVLRGQWLALLGPNGSGKSTLLRILATLDRPDSGSVSILGVDLSSDRSVMAGVRARMGVVFQRPSLDSLLTVRENLVLQAALLGLSRTEARDRAHAAADALGVADRMDSRVAALSGGLLRRADIARALLAEPELLLLDEPTTGLDLESRRGLLDVLDRRRRANAQPLTIIHSTHLMEEASRADRVALMHEGNLVAQGAPNELRDALGGRVIVTGPSHAALLESAGLSVTRTESEAVGSGSLDAIERAAGELIRSGAVVSVGPPTLADVYLARAGTHLSPRTDPGMDSP